MAIKSEQYDPLPDEFWAEMVDTNYLGVSTVGKYSVLELWVGDGCTFVFRLPDDFTNLMWARMVMIPDTTETVEAGFLINASAAGEGTGFNTQNSWGETLPVVKNKLTEWNIASLFPPLAAGDYVGIQVWSDTAILRVIGLVIKYN